MLIGQLKGREG